MKALTLWQPWASLVAMEQKRIETRVWSTKHRGEIAIHAAAHPPANFLGASARTPAFRDELADVFNVRRDRDERTGKHVDDVLRELPYGKVLCIVKLHGVVHTQLIRDELARRERIFGNYEDGRYAWLLEVVEVFDKPIAAKGRQMLWNWSR